MPWSRDLLAAGGWVERGVLVHMHPSQQSQNHDFILDQLTFDSLYWLWYSITVNHCLIVELWSSCKMSSPQSRGSGQAAPDATHAQKKLEKFVMRLFDFHATVTRCSLSVRGMIIWASIKSNQCQMASDWHGGGIQIIGWKKIVKMQTLILNA